MQYIKHFSNEFLFQLTPIGMQLSNIPIDPRLGKMIFLAMALKCLDPILTIVSCMSRDSPFIETPSSNSFHRTLHHHNALLDHNSSDHLALLKAYQLWHSAPNVELKRQVIIILIIQHIIIFFRIFKD